MVFHCFIFISIFLGFFGSFFWKSKLIECSIWIFLKLEIIWKIKFSISFFKENFNSISFRKAFLRTFSLFLWIFFGKLINWSSHFKNFGIKKHLEILRFQSLFFFSNLKFNYNCILSIYFKNNKKHLLGDWSLFFLISKHPWNQILNIWKWMLNH